MLFVLRMLLLRPSIDRFDDILRSFLRWSDSLSYRRSLTRYDKLKIPGSSEAGSVPPVPMPDI